MRRRTRSGRRLVVLGVVAISVFVLIDIVLLLVATSHPAVVAADGPPPAPILPTPTPTPTVQPLTLGARARLLVPVDDHSAWRSAAAACGGAAPAVLELTTDSGATWTSHGLGDAALTSIVAISPYAGTSTVGVLAADADCKTAYQISFTSGRFWKAYPNELPSTLAYPADGASLHTAGGVLTTPCPTIGAFAVRSSTESAVVCDDAGLRLSFDAGSTWQPVDIGSPVLSVVPTDGGYLVAAWTGEGCDGVRFATVRMPDLVIAPGPCEADLTTAVGTTLASSPHELWLWSGDTVLQSSDGGATWTAPGP